MWTIFKVFIEFVAILLMFYILGFWPQSMWELSSLTRDQTCTPSLEDMVLTLDHQGNPPLKCFDILLNSDLSQCSDLGHIDSKGGWGPRERTLRCFSNNSWNYPQVFPLKGPVVIYLSDYTLRKRNSLIFWELLDTGCELTMVLRSEAVPWPPCWNEGWWGPRDK